MIFTQGDFWPTGTTLRGRALFCVTKSFTYSGGGLTVTIPDGFVFDGPSIPFWALPFIDVGAIFLPAALHDYLYQETDWLKEDCDWAFYYALKLSGVPKIQRKMCYWSVRLFGRTRRKRKEGLNV